MPNESELDVKHQLRERKEAYYDKTRNLEVDAADYSVSDYGSTHGIGSNLMYGDVNKWAGD